MKCHVFVLNSNDFQAHIKLACMLISTTIWRNLIGSKFCFCLWRQGYNEASQKQRHYESIYLKPRQGQILTAKLKTINVKLIYVNVYHYAYYFFK